jgi:hypothetical protein
MVRRWRAAVVVGALAALGGACSSSNKCQYVDCAPPATCNPKDGTCQGGSDGGTTDAGSACGTCPATAPVCDTTNNTCVTCTATAGCNALAPLCNTAITGGQCVQCMTSNDCPPLQPTCTPSNTCVAADAGPPPNNSCANAQALDLSTGSATVQGTTTGASVLSMPGDQSPTCSASALTFGQSVVYSLQLSGANDVLASVVPTSTSTLEPVLYLRDANCTSGLAADEVACASPLSLPPSLGIPDLDAGASTTYYLFVSGAGGSSGDFTLQVNLDPPTAPATNATCATAKALVFNGSGLATASGSTFDVPFADSSDCNGFDAPTARTVFYKFTTASLGRVDVTVAANDGGYGFVPIIYATDTSCSISNQFACAPLDPSDPATLEIPGLAAGTYVLGVEGYNGTSGPFTLQAQFTPPPSNDACPGQALSFTGGTATAQGDTSVAASTRNATCAGVSSDQSFDLAYQFQLTTAQDVQVDVQANPGSNLLPMIFVGPAAQCTADGNGPPCGFTQTRQASLFLPNQPAGTYFLWVDTGTYPTPDGFGTPIGQPGAFTATVQLAAPTTQSTAVCPGAALTLPATGIMGTNIGSAEAFADACMVPGNSGPAPSVEYRLTVPSKQQLTVTVTPTPSSPLLQPGIFLGDSAGCVANGLGCSAALAPGLPAQLVVPELAAGTYALVVTGIDTTDALNGAVGTFTLDASLDPVQGPPDNVSCDDAGVLAFDPTPVGYTALSQGTTVDAGVHAQFFCGTPANTNPSVVYAFTTPPSGTDGGLSVRVSATALNGLETTPVVTMRVNCIDDAQGAQLACGTEGLPQLASTVALNLKAGSTYSVWVGATDGGASGAGPFSLEVDLAPVPAPNESCADPMALDANTTVSGTTLGARDDMNNAGTPMWYSQTDGGSGCDNIFDSSLETGADVVYSYVATATSDVTVLVTPEPSLMADVIVMNACQPGACVTSAIASNGPGSPVAATFPAIQGQTYYFAVDSSVPAVPGASAGRGAFGIGAWQ